MKISGRNLKKRLHGQVSELKNRLSRARHFRGHGVHSPFIYDIVRHVFMRNKLLAGDTTFYRALAGSGVSRRRAVQLQNLLIHCDYASFGLNCADAALCVALCGLSGAETLEIVRVAAQKGSTVVIMSPYNGREREVLCSTIVAAHSSTTVDNRGYLLIFNNNLPKQHFKI